ANTALEAEQHRLRTLFEQAPGFVAVMDGPDHHFSMANAAYLRLVGNRNVLGRPIAEVLPEVVEQGLVALLDEVMRTRKPFLGRQHRVLLAQRPGGEPEERFVDFVFQPILNGGAATGVFVQGHDVTEQKRAVDALRESEGRFRLVAESAPVKLWMSTPTGNCVYLNRTQRAFWGVTEEEATSFDWFSTVHPEDRGVIAGPYQAAMRDHTGFETVARFRRHDGAWRTLRTEAQPRFGPAGEFLGMIGVNVDITEMRRAEGQLRQLNETLEARVTAEIAERRHAEAALAQAQKMESIGKLTGGVAHDFNNLLQVVSGNLQLLARDLAGNERAERRLNNAMAGVTRGPRLAAQLLAFGRRQPLEPKAVHVGRFVNGMEEMLRRTIGEAIEIRTIVPDGLWNGFIDPAQAENALLNLAINARDAMESTGMLTIEAANAIIDNTDTRAHPDLQPGEYVVLAVTDTGCGMTPEVQAMAFEPFFSTKAEGKGSGLGLSMVYGFVKQSGGHVKIYSEVGQGTTVRLYLPRALQAEEAVPPPEAGIVAGGTETVLVAEDDEAVRATVVEMLTELGYRVLQAHDAASALAVIESGVPVDLLFTDVIMPGALKSPEMARRARELIPGLAVLFTSGYTENSIVHAGRLDPGVELLSKPYTREALARRLRQVLANARHGAAALQPSRRQTARGIPPAP
ncbi:MAG TPA: PAS domain S-box protein, partial [Roseomonas sp.]